jgi:hypothetical protein
LGALRARGMLLNAVRPQAREEVRAVFLFRLQKADGSPAEPATLDSAVPNWKPGHQIHLGERTLRVLAVRDDDADQPPVLVVEDGPHEPVAQLRKLP